ncbi:putative Integral membrane protein [Seiridium cardinale]|uniref:Integral membrane protein n=1 Tax=Seiridium cardinale TaxID=138064 RepID=A0ABR2XVL1_9PEZI
MSLIPEQIEYFQEHASDDWGPSDSASAAAGLFLAYLFVGSRIWARKTGKMGLSHDDWLVIAALVPLTTYVILAWLTVSFGEGKHIIFITNVAGFVRGYVAAIVVYAICVVLTKLSILCLYCRIFFPVKSLFYISWGFGIFILAYNLALIFVTAFECIPLSSIWTGAPGKCIETLPPFTTLGIINVVTDVGILALPVRHIMQLRLNITQRIQVCGMFLLCGLACVFGIIRVVALARAPPGDPSYNQVWSGIWSFCEIAIGIVAACLPTLAVLVTKAHFSKTSASVIRLLAFTVRRSQGISGTNTRATGQSVRDTRSGDNAYTELPEWSLVRGKSGDSMYPIRQDNADVSTFVASSLAERGKRGTDQSCYEHDPAGGRTHLQRENYSTWQ